MAESDLEKNAEFTQVFRAHDGGEDPLITAQRFLNIFRQLHIFTAAKRKEFDEDLLKLPPVVRGSFVNLPGGSLLQDYVNDLEQKAGVAVSAPVKPRIERGSSDSGQSPAPAADSSIEDIKKLLEADIASRHIAAQTAQQAPVQVAAGPVSGEVRLVADDSLKNDLFSTISKIMEENRSAQVKSTQTLAQYLQESQQKMAEILAQKSSDGGNLAESLAHVFEANKDSFKVNVEGGITDSGKLIDEIIEKQSTLFLEMSERQSDKLGSVLSSALQETNQASTKMIMDALEAFQKENTRLINMQEKIQRAILETEKRNSAPYSGFTLTTGNVSINKDPSLDSPVSGFGFNTGLMGFGSDMSSAVSQAPKTAAPAAQQPAEDKTEDVKQANFDRLESLLSDADSLFNLDGETSSKKKKKKKKKKKNKEADKANETGDDIIVLYDDELEGAAASKDTTAPAATDEHQSVPAPATFSEEQKEEKSLQADVETGETASAVPLETSPAEAAENQADEEWEYVNPEEYSSVPAWEYETVPDGKTDEAGVSQGEWKYETGESGDSAGDAWEYVEEAEPENEASAQEWEYTEEEVPAEGDDSGAWEYVSEEEASQAGSADEEWEYADASVPTGDNQEEEWEYVSAEDGSGSDDGGEWEYVSEEEEAQAGSTDEEWEYVPETEADSEVFPATDETDNLQEPVQTNISAGDSTQALPDFNDDTAPDSPAMPTDVFNPLYGEQIQLDKLDDSASGQMNLSGLRLYEVSEFDGAADDPYNSAKQ